MLFDRVKKQIGVIVERFGTPKVPMATIESVIPQEPLIELSAEYTDAVIFSMGPMDSFHRTAYVPSGTFEVGDQVPLSRLESMRMTHAE